MDETWDEASTSASNQIAEAMTVTTEEDLALEPNPVEREQTPFSYDASQLRRRHTSTTQAESQTPTEEQSDSKRRISLDHSSSGGGFYECNIW